MIGPNIVYDGLSYMIDARNDKSYINNGILLKNLGSCSTSNSLFSSSATYSLTENAIDFVTGSYLRGYSCTYAPYGTNDLTDTVFTKIVWLKRYQDIVNGAYWTIGNTLLPSTNFSSSGFMSSYTSVSNKIGFSIVNTNFSPVAFREYNTGQDYPLNEWVCVTWVKNGSGFSKSVLKIYINGIEYDLVNTVNEGSFTQCVSFFNIFHFGDYAIFPSTSGKYLASIMIYDRALSSAEILQNYNATKHKFI